MKTNTTDTKNKTNTIDSKIDFGHGDKELSPIELRLMTKGVVIVKGVTYTTKSINIQTIFTDKKLLPVYNVCVNIENHPRINDGCHQATGTLRQCFEYFLTL